MNSQIRLTVYAAVATLATASALAAVFAGGSWIGPVLGAIVAVAVGTLATRWSPLPSALEAPVAALFVLGWIDLLYARSEAYLGVIPNGSAMHQLARVARAGFDDIRHLPSPVPTHHGVVLIATVGVAAVALLVDLLVVAVRRAVLAGLPLLGLFTVCAVTAKHGAGIGPFILGAAGYAALLFAEHREHVSRWGSATAGALHNTPGGWPARSAAARAPAAVGRRIGIAVIGVGAVMPLVVPGLHGGVHGGGSNRNGDSSVLTINPIVSIADDLRSTADTPILRYTTHQATPEYLRLTSLDVYDTATSTFSAAKLEAPAQARVRGALPGVPAGPTATTTDVSVGPIQLRWLPITRDTTSVHVDGDWRYDANTGTVFSASDDTQNLSYQFTSSPRQPTRRQLSTVSASFDTSKLAGDLLLGHISPAVIALTRHVIRHATTPYQKAVAIQAFLTSSPFTYSTNIPADNSGHALAHFLLHTHRGFCQQYAAAMAVMARIALIPSRVAVGFTRGEQQPDGTWVVTTHDAHAWPELYFAGYGWVPFEPTPRNDGQVLTPSYTLPASSAGNGGGAHPNDTRSGKQQGKSGQRAGGLPKGLRGGSNGSGQSQGSSSSAGPVIGGVIGGLVVIALIGPGLSRLVVRRRRRRRMRDPVTGSAAAWAELRASALDVGLSWDEGRSPRELAHQVGAALAATAGSGDALARICRREEQSRYAAAAPPADGSVGRDLDLIRRALRGRQSRWGRIRAVLLPRSVVMSVVGEVQKFAGRAAELPGRVADRLPLRALRVGRGAG
ncbi:MAG TPA: DUF3488 and transglutaminase-like domain-containing protein [Mycobacteriales bacterium]|nr:DUF3488 and transglutaminase-like domain-containing protein [Mycobacteriales bacterium]